MSMFCYQCQETAMGTGCTLKGVCGKTSEVANLQDLLLFVVRGIAVYNEHLRKDGHPSEQADKFAPKSYHRLRSMFTLKDGSCSSLNGDLYHRLSPCRLTGL